MNVQPESSARREDLAQLRRVPSAAAPVAASRAAERGGRRGGADARQGRGRSGAPKRRRAQRRSRPRTSAPRPPEPDAPAEPDAAGDDGDGVAWLRAIKDVAVREAPSGDAERRAHFGGRRDPPARQRAPARRASSGTWPRAARAHRGRGARAGRARGRRGCACATARALCEPAEGPAAGSRARAARLALAPARGREAAEAWAEQVRRARARASTAQRDGRPLSPPRARDARRSPPTRRRAPRRRLSADEVAAAPAVVGAADAPPPLPSPARAAPPPSPPAPRPKKKQRRRARGFARAPARAPGRAPTAPAPLGEHDRARDGRGREPAPRARRRAASPSCVTAAWSARACAASRRPAARPRARPRGCLGAACAGLALERGRLAPDVLAPQPPAVRARRRRRLAARAPRALPRSRPLGGLRVARVLEPSASRCARSRASGRRARSAGDGDGEGGDGPSRSSCAASAAAAAQARPRHGPRAEVEAACVRPPAAAARPATPAAPGVGRRGRRGRGAPKVEYGAKLVATEPKRVLVAVPGAGGDFDFERVLAARAREGDAYHRMWPPRRSVGAALFAGRRGCVLAYGQTGSGKTHTMFGADGALRAAATDTTAGRALGGAAGVVPPACSPTSPRAARLRGSGRRSAGGALGRRVVHAAVPRARR